MILVAHFGTFIYYVLLSFIFFIIGSICRFISLTSRAISALVGRCDSPLILFCSFICRWVIRIVSGHVRVLGGRCAVINRILGGLV